MIFVLVLIILLLFASTIWLWRLSQAQASRLVVFAVTRLIDRFNFEPAHPRDQPPLHQDKYLTPLLKIEYRRHTKRHLRSAIGEKVAILETAYSRVGLGLGFSIKYVGIMNFPKKVYEGDSQNIFLTLEREFSQEFPSTTLDLENTANGKRVTLEIQKKEKGEQFLEVELLAAAFEIDGEKKQKQSLTLERLVYQWNCLFKSAGNHEICLVLKMIRPSGEEYFGSINQTIRAVKFDHATQRQVQIWAAVAGAVTLLVGVATFLSTVLGFWHLH